MVYSGHSDSPVRINGARMDKMDLQNLRGLTPPGNFIFTELCLLEKIISNVRK